MIGKHIVLTLMVGGGACALWWLKPPPEWNGARVFGMGLRVVGFILWAIARFQLGASFAVRAEARKLITSGLYSKIRNPIYVFGLRVIAGAIWRLGSSYGC